MMERASQPSQIGDGRTVFVVHGRNENARDAMFEFLRSLDLNPLEWNQAVALTGVGSPYIGEVLDKAFSAAQAVVVLLTPDDIAYLRSEYSNGHDQSDLDPKGQARPNVLFEAGMAFGRHAERTILVELGDLRPFSDVAGRHVVRISSKATSRQQLAQRLKIAGCQVNSNGEDWLKTGDFDGAIRLDRLLPLGKRLPTARSSDSIRLDATYHNRGKGSGTLQITNHSPVDVFDLVLEFPPEVKESFHVVGDFPMKKLPATKSVSFPTASFMGGGELYFEFVISAKTPEGDEVRSTAFISLIG